MILQVPLHSHHRRLHGVHAGLNRCKAYSDILGGAAQQRLVGRR